MFGLDFETEEIEVEVEDIFDLDDVIARDEFVGGVDDAAVARILADGFDVDDVFVGFGDEGAREFEAEDF